MRKIPLLHISLSLALALFMAMMAGCAKRPQWAQTNAPGGETILSFAVSPGGPGGSKLFAGTGGGGVFLSTDGGASWAPAGLKGEWVTALVISGPNIIAGTGGSGVFLSTDDGANWTPAGLANEWVTAFAVNGTHVFAGTWDGKGIFLSTDGGKNWAASNAGLPPEIKINALAVGPGGEGGTKVYAGTYGEGVFLLKNDGTSWAAVNSGLTAWMINALAASGANLFAGAPEGVFLSKDGGASWAEVNDGLSNTNVFALVSSGRNLFAGTYGGGVFISADDGAHWTAVNDGLAEGNVRALALSPDEPGGAKVLASTQGGVFRSTRGAAAWAVRSAGGTKPAAAAAPREPDPYESVKTIRAARVLDGRGGVVENAVIEVTNSKITKIDQRPGPVTYDLGQATVLPGLIDVHLHLTHVVIPGWNTGGPIPPISFYSEAVLANARSTLMAGFTTVQSLGAGNDKPMRDAIESMAIVGPRVITSLYPIWAAAKSPEELRKRVRQAKADGADVIKFFASEKFLYGGQINVTQAQADAVCAEAKALGLRCVVHAHSAEAIMVAVKAGCTSIEHGFYADEAAMQAMARAGVYFDPNIGAALQVELENQPLPPAAVAKIEECLLRNRAMFQKALAAGLRMPMGTDITGGGHGQNAREIIARVEAGQKPMEAIIGATSLAAESLRMEKTIGTLAPGYEADIIAVGGDPLKDIAALKNVTFVMKGGLIFKR